MTAMTIHTVRSALASDEAAVVDVVLLAFASDPAARWTWADPQEYLRTFPRFIKAFAGRAFEQGSAHCAEDLGGAALWLPPGIGSDEEAMGALIQSTVPERLHKDVVAVGQEMVRCHPSEPHWYLPFIAVDPARQGKGYGGALLKHGLAACDRDRNAAYLESTNPRNVPLYQRHGFELLGTIQVGSSPPIFPMLRKRR
jgi:ribosomal protein S18 acetylase RimI-like enzyme